MCQVKCKAVTAKLHVPPLKSTLRPCLFCHINGVTRLDGVGANHIFPPVSLSPKAHLSQFLHRLL